MTIWGSLCLGLCLAITGTTGQSDADVEFFSPSCPVKNSIPGFKFQTISALGIAALLNASEDIGTFLEIGCDPNFNQTFLTYIKTKCENPIFEKLGIPCAREVKIKGYTPLLLAVLYGTPATVQKLSDIPGIDLDAANSDLYSPLWVAANKGNMQMVRSLVEAGAYLEISGGKYLTKPLGEAVLFGSVEMVRYLLSKGAYIDSRSNTDSTPANYAASYGNLEILKILKTAGADLDGMHGQGDATLLMVAVANNQADIVDYLINQKVDVNKQDADGKNALGFAAVKNYLNILQSLVRAGADLDVLYEPEKFSALSNAILFDNSDIAHFLIKSGADVNTQSSEGYTAPFIAAQKNNLPILEALVEAGANLETKGGPFEMTPLAVAALKGHIDIVQYLTANGANLQATDKDGKTALDLAREYGNDDVVNFLEEK